MKKVVVLLLISLISLCAFADAPAPAGVAAPAPAEKPGAVSVSVTLKNGKSVNGKLVKIEAAQLSSQNSLSEATTLNAAQGIKDLMLMISDIKEIVFVSSDDMSCFDDGRFVPVRKFCSMKSLYRVVLKKPAEGKEPVEVTDDRVFFFHITGEKSPIPGFFYKVQVSNEGREDKTDYPDLEREVLNLVKNGIKKITFK
ncbi:hypothetical protein J5834_04915 [bacterium]|nr:hypothetical protein [bacterium]